MPGTTDIEFHARRAATVNDAVTLIRTHRTRLAWPLFAAAGVAMTLTTGACSENRPFERESAGVQTKLAVPSSMTPPISVRGIDGAPGEWKLSERVAEALRSRDIPASAANRSRSAFVLKGEMRQGVERNGRSRVEVVWSLFDGVGRKVGEVTQMAAVPGAAFRVPNEGVIEAMADAAAESIAPLVPSSSVQLADGTETGERKGNDRAKIEDRDRVTAVGKMQANTGVSKNLLEPAKREVKPQVKIDAGTDPAKPAARYSATPPGTATSPAPSKSPPAARYSATPPASAMPPAPNGDKKAVTAVGRYEGTSALSRNLFRPEIDPSKPLPLPQRVTRAKDETPRQISDSEESLGSSPEPASDTRRVGPPTRLTPPQRAEAESPRPDVATPPERARQVAESPAPRREPKPEPPPEPEQYAERAAPRAGYQYWIQIGAHKDEATSRAEWQRAQSTASGAFANVGNRIQRADLGARGVYYRIQLGPFASPGEAGQFCAQLKARQIDCFLAAPEAATAAAPPAGPDTMRKSLAPPPAEAPRKAAPPPAAPKPVAKPAEPKPRAAPPAEKPKEAATAPKKPEPEHAAPLPEQKPPPRNSAEKPDAPISTAPGLPGVLD